jgi:hypothetical protein
MLHSNMCLVTSILPKFRRSDRSGLSYEKFDRFLAFKRKKFCLSKLFITVFSYQLFVELFITSVKSSFFLIDSQTRPGYGQSCAYYSCYPGFTCDTATSTCLCSSAVGGVYTTFYSLDLSDIYSGTCQTKFTQGMQYSVLNQFQNSCFDYIFFKWTRCIVRELRR